MASLFHYAGVESPHRTGNKALNPGDAGAKPPSPGTNCSVHSRNAQFFDDAARQN